MPHIHILRILSYTITLYITILSNKNGVAVAGVDTGEKKDIPNFWWERFAHLEVDVGREMEDWQISNVFCDLEDVPT